MAYTKITWAADMPLNVANLAHLETQADVLEAERAAITHADRYYTEAQYIANYWSKTNMGPGSGANAATLNGMTKTQILAASLPASTVIMWYGDIASMPTGYLLMDGNNGTIDMRGRIPVAAGYGVVVRTLGGADAASFTGSGTIGSCTLTVGEMGAHQHAMTDNVCNLTADNDGGTPENLQTSAGYTDYRGGGGAHSHPGTTTITSTSHNYPPVKAVYFLVKT